MPKIRIEFCTYGGGRGRLGGQVDVPESEPLGSVSLDVTASPTPAGSRPVVPSASGTVFATLLATDAALYVDVAAAPDPASEPRLLLLPGRPQLVHVTPGQAVAAIIASDVSVLADSGAVALSDRSGNVASGGTAQQVCAPNATRRILVVANPDDTRSFTFRTDGPASNGAGSLLLGPGGAFVFDKVVPSGDISILGAATGQPFTVKEA